MQWEDRSEDVQRYLASRLERTDPPDVKNPQRGLYVLWVANPTPYRVRDYQKTPKTEILPMGFAVKSGKHTRGFFERRGLDYQQLHVAGEHKLQDNRWVENDRKDSRAFPATFRQIVAIEGSVERERELNQFVQKWLDNRKLRILAPERLGVIDRNNRIDGREKIGLADFPKPQCEWLHVHSFDEELFRTLTSELPRWP